MYSVLIGCLFMAFVYAVQTELHCCEDNWTIYRSGCYLFVKDRMSFKESKLFCRSRDSELITFNDVHEMTDFMRSHSMWNTASWINLIARNTTEPDFDVMPVMWDVTGQETVDINKINFLVKLPSRGVSPVAKCAAFFNPQALSIPAYVHMYDCILPNYFVCERIRDLTSSAVNMDGVKVNEDDEPAVAADEQTSTASSPVTKAATAAPSGEATKSPEGKAANIAGSVMQTAIEMHPMNQIGKLMGGVLGGIP